MNFLLWTLGLSWWCYALESARAAHSAWTWAWWVGLVWWCVGGLGMVALAAARRARNVMPPLLARRAAAFARPGAPRTQTEVESGKGKA